MPPLTIRPAISEDSAALSRLLTELGHPTSDADLLQRWPAWVEQGNHALVAVQSDGGLHGLITLHSMIVLHRPRPVGRVTSLVVDCTLRGQGIGRALMAAAESHFLQAGCGLVEITSHQRLVDAHAFYQQLGYARTGIRLAKELPTI
ncbi:MAG: GNAT family N-acetyltransferase [Candidatus Aquirickettsiella gammari]